MKKFLNHFWPETKSIFKIYFWGAVVGAIIAVTFYPGTDEYTAAMKIGFWHCMGQMYGGALAVFLAINILGLIVAPLWGFCSYMDHRKNL